MEEIAFTLDEYEQLMFYMEFSIGLTKPKRRKYVVPYNRLVVSGHFLEKYVSTGFFNYEVIGENTYAYSLTQKGADYLSSILGVTIKL